MAFDWTNTNYTFATLGNYAASDDGMTVRGTDTGN